jgi:hypothetical protein
MYDFPEMDVANAAPTADRGRVDVSGALDVSGWTAGQACFVSVQLAQ